MWAGWRGGAAAWVRVRVGASVELPRPPLSSRPLAPPRAPAPCAQSDTESWTDTDNNTDSEDERAEEEHKLRKREEERAKEREEERVKALKKVRMRPFVCGAPARTRATSAVCCVFVAPDK